MVASIKDLEELISQTIKRHCKYDLNSILIKTNKIIIKSYYTSELYITDCIHFESSRPEPEYIER